LVNPIAKCFSPLPPGQSAFAIPQKNSTDRNSCLCAIPPGVIATLAPIRKLLKNILLHPMPRVEKLQILEKLEGLQNLRLSVVRS